LVRRIGIVLLTALFNARDTKFTALAVCCLAFLLVHMWLRPYPQNIDNVFESFSWTILALICMLMAFAPVPLPTAESIALTVIIAITIIILFVRLIVSRASRAATGGNHRRSRKSMEIPTLNTENNYLQHRRSSATNSTMPDILRVVSTDEFAHTRHGRNRSIIELAPVDVASIAQISMTEHNPDAKPSNKSSNMQIS
jgi:hypothetical protein